MKVVRGYTHHDGSIGVMARFEVGSDFTSRTPEFKKFADDLLMSLALEWRDCAGLLRLLSDDSTPMDCNGTSWIGEEFNTVGDALAGAIKLFREPIVVDDVVIFGDGVDRAPKHTRPDAH